MAKTTLYSEDAESLLRLVLMAQQARLATFVVIDGKRYLITLTEEGSAR